MNDSDEIDNTFLGANEDDELGEILQKFGHALNDCQREVILATEGFKHNYEKILERNADGKTGSGDEPGLASLGTQLAVDDIGAENPSYMILLSRASGYDDGLSLSVQELYNIQLRWILVHAYEIYQDFIKGLYAKSDSPEEQQSVTDILRHFRKRLPSLKNTEEHSCKENWSLKEWIKIVEKFRHSIVHCRGWIDEDDLKKDLGLSPDTKPDNPKSQSISVFVTGSVNKDSDEIQLFDRKLLKKEEKYSSLPSRILDLIQTIATHGCLVYKCLAEHLGKPVWLRKGCMRISKKEICNSHPHTRTLF